MLGLICRGRLCSICVAVALLASLYATSSLAAARFRHLTMEDGLSNNEIFEIIQDRKG